jgi:hypothetical protein
MNFKKCIAVQALLLLLLLIPQAGEAGIAIVGGLTRERQVEPGKTYQGTIQIRNTEDEPVEIKIYQTDYLFYSDGRIFYGEPGEDPRSNAKWISYSPTRLTIPPQGLSEVNYRYQVPNDQSMIGTYWSMLMVEALAEGSPEALGAEKDKVTLGIRHAFRFAIQMVTHISDTGKGKLKLDAKLVKEEEKRFLQIAAENVGERWLRPSLWVKLYDEQGKYVGKFEGRGMRLYPGTSISRKIDLSDVPRGVYKALLVLDAGGDDIFGASYTLKFK